MGSKVQDYEASWEPDIAKRILSEAAAADQDSGRPYMVALVGIPGSGKSISTFLLANTLEEAGISVMICPHDGYHYPLEQLKQFPNPDDMIYRRGAPDTFDPQALHRDLERIRHGNDDSMIIMVPGFDHAKGDPEPDSHVFDRSKHNVVICEGLVSTPQAQKVNYIVNLVVSSKYVFLTIVSAFLRYLSTSFMTRMVGMRLRAYLI